MVDGLRQALMHTGGWSGQVDEGLFPYGLSFLVGFVWACSCGGGRALAAERASPPHAQTLLMIMSLWPKQVTQLIPDSRSGKMGSSLDGRNSKVTVQRGVNLGRRNCGHFAVYHSYAKVEGIVHFELYYIFLFLFAL